MAAQIKYGFISTISTQPGLEGTPFGNVVSFGDGGSGTPYFCLSPMDASVQDLLKNPKLVETVSADEFPESLRDRSRSEMGITVEASEKPGAYDDPFAAQRAFLADKTAGSPAGTVFAATDAGACNPRYVRSTMSTIPNTGDLLHTSGMPLTILVQPLAVPHPDEEPIHVVDNGEAGPVRCARCKAYMNPFARWVDHGRPRGAESPTEGWASP